MKTRLIVGLSVFAIHVAAGPARADEISLAAAPPVVVRTVPSAGSTNVDPSLTELRVTYSKAMQDGGWSWSTWGEENFPKTTGTPHYLDDKRTCVLPVKLEPDQFYATWLNTEKFGNFTDTNGRSAVPYLLTFRTGKTVGGISGELDARIAQLAKAGTTVEEAISVLGEPRGYAWENQTLRKENLPSTYIMIYPEGVNVVVHDGVVTELRSHPPGPGFTYRGRLRLGSSLEEMLEVVGPPSETVTGQPLAFEASVLYRDINGEKGRAYYARPDQQIRCFFMRNKISALYMPLGEPSGTAAGSGTPESSGATRVKALVEEPGGKSVERSINKSINEFPSTEDLSTPEGACVAWQRASAHKDVAALNRLSIVQIDPAQQAEWYSREEKRDAEGLAIYLKALAESKIVKVQIWRGEVASVITLLPFPEGKGRRPYGARTFGLVNGAWKNMGEDRLPDAETAAANFENNKERLWNHFNQVKGKTASE